MAPRKRPTKTGHVWEDVVWFRRADGSRHQRYAYGKTKAACVEAKAKLLKERRTSPKVRRVNDDDPTRWPLSRLGERWMAEHVATLTDHTQEYYRNQLKHRIAPYLYRERVGVLKKRDVIAWRSELLADKHGPRSINAAVSTLGAMYGWMLATWEDVELVDPTAKVKNLDENVRAVRVLESGDVLNIADQFRLIRRDQTVPMRGSMNVDRARLLDLRDTTMLVVMAYCGLRMGELLGLQRRDYDPADGREVGWLTLERQVLARSGKYGPLKGKRARTTPVLDSVRRALGWYLAAMPDSPPDSPLFPAMNGADPSRWGPISQNRWRAKHFKAAAGKAGYPSLLPHDMRHTFASLWIERSRGRVTPVRLAKWMGHRDATVTLTLYAHLYDKVEDEIFRDVDAGLFLDALT